jgi:hypothetical protein
MERVGSHAVQLNVRVYVVASWPRRENLGSSASVVLPAFAYSWSTSLLLWVILLAHLVWIVIRVLEARREGLES